MATEKYVRVRVVSLTGRPRFRAGHSWSTEQIERTVTQAQYEKLKTDRHLVVVLVAEGVEAPAPEVQVAVPNIADLMLQFEAMKAELAALKAKPEEKPKAK